MTLFFKTSSLHTYINEFETRWKAEQIEDETIYAGVLFNKLVLLKQDESFLHYSDPSGQILLCYIQAEVPRVGRRMGPS